VFAAQDLSLLYSVHRRFEEFVLDIERINVKWSEKRKYTIQHCESRLPIHYISRERMWNSYCSTPFIYFFYLL
jgi:hypothetical protein